MRFSPCYDAFVALCLLFTLAQSMVIKPLSPNPAKPSKVLLLVHGYQVEHFQYRELAQELVKEATPSFNLYVALIKTVLEFFPDPVTVGFSLQEGLKNVRSAGFENFDTKRDVWIAGHSFSAKLASTQWKNYAGLVVYASYLSKGDLSNMTVPILHISGSNDGINRVARMVPVYQEMTRLEEIRPWEKPVVILPVITALCK